MTILMEPCATAWRASSCAFDIIGGRYLRDVEPGEVVTLGEDGLQSRIVDAEARRAFCVFEVHLLRPSGLAHERPRSAGRARSDGRESCGARRPSRRTW